MKKENLLYFFLFFVLAYLIGQFIYDVYDIRFITQDDVEYFYSYSSSDFSYIHQTKSYLLHTATRPLFHLLMSIPYLVNSAVYVKTVQLVFILLPPFLLAYFLKIVTRDGKLSFLYLIFYFAFLQYSFQHNILFAYPFYFHFAASMLICSFITLYLFFVRNKKIYYFASVVCYTIALMQYEIFVLFVPIHFLFTTLAKREKGDFKYLLGYVVPIVLLIVLDVSLKSIGGRNYSGTSVHIESPVDILRAIIFFSSSAFPAFEAIFHKIIANNYLEYFIDIAKIDSEFLQKSIFQILNFNTLIKSILVFLSTFVILSSIKSKPNMRLLYGLMALSFIYIFVPNVLLALTPKYQEWAKYYEFHYVTTYFSILSVTLFMVSLFYMTVVLFKKHHKAATLLASLAPSLTVFLVDFGNYYPMTALKLSSHRWNLLDCAIEEKLIRNGSCLNMDSLNLHSYSHMKTTNRLWQLYLQAKGLTVDVRSNCPNRMEIVQNPNTRESILIIRYPQKSCIVSTTNIDNLLTTSFDRVKQKKSCYIYCTNKRFRSIDISGYY